MTSTPDPTDPAQRLARAAAQAAAVRTRHDDPEVVALRVERVRTVVDRLIWTGMIAGLLFTMTNVQHFAAAGAPTGSLRWWIAWLLDPTVSLVLLGVLFAERLTSRHQIQPGPWTRYGKWALLGATYLMNTWASWAAGDAAGVVLHSVPPLVVFVAAEAIAELQDKLTECAHRAHTTATTRAHHNTTATGRRPADGDRLPGQVVAAHYSRLGQTDAAATGSAAGATTTPAAVPAGRPAAVAAAAVTGQEPRTTPATTTTRTTGKAASGRGRRATPDLGVLVAHARPILDREPGLGRRELAHRLGEQLAVVVAPYWAAKAKAEITQHRPLHAAAGGPR